MEGSDDRVLNPWITIWLQPRATIQQIVDTDPTRMVLVLAALAGIGRALNRASLKDVGDHLSWPVILAMAVVLGPLGGIVLLYLSGLLVRVTGKWIGGAGSGTTIRCAMAWSCIPAICVLPLWIPNILIFGQELFTSEMSVLVATPHLEAVFWCMMGVELIVSIWGIIIFLKCLGQVQGFSAWKALLNVIMAFLLLVLPIFAIIFGTMAIVGFPAN